MTTLRFIDSGAFRPDLPSHDIDAAELAFMAKSRKISEQEIVDAAVGSGLFVVEGQERVAVSEPVDTLPDGEPHEKTLDEMSRDELRAICKDLGLTVGGKIGDLLERIRAKLAEAPAVEGTEDTAPVPSVPSVPSAVAE
jgi:hypothetical protein